MQNFGKRITLAPAAPMPECHELHLEEFLCTV